VEDLNEGLPPQNNVGFGETPPPPPQQQTHSLQSSVEFLMAFYFHRVRMEIFWNSHLKLDLQGGCFRLKLCDGMKETPHII